jgi:hypothetical protein
MTRKVTATAMTKTKEEKQKDIAGAGETPDGKKRRRRVTGPTKAEMSDKLAAFEKAEAERVQFPPITPKQLELTTQGLLMVAEGLSKLPFGDVDKTLIAGFNESAAACINTYMPGSYFKYIPLMQLANSMALITLDAIDKGRKQKKKTAGQLPPPDKK